VDGSSTGTVSAKEAVTRANMRFVETKTLDQQSCLMLHRTRQLFIRQQTSVINAIRAHMAEFGIVAPVGRKGVEQLLAIVTEARTNACLSWRAPVSPLSFPKIISGRIGGAVQPGSEWRR
jgi:transposase